LKITVVPAISADFSGESVINVQFAAGGARVCVATSERLHTSMFGIRNRLPGAGGKMKGVAKNDRSLAICKNLPLNYRLLAFFEGWRWPYLNSWRSYV